MGFPAINPAIQFFDDSGNPLSGGKLFSYVQSTATKKTTYTNADLNANNTNPIVLDDAGRCSLFLADGETYKFVLAPADDTDPPTNPIWTRDKVKSPFSIGQFAETAAETTSTVTVVDDSYPVGNTPRYGIVANSAPAAAANTAILKLLLDPTVAGITGDVKFLNESGSDIYYFNDIIPIRDGVHIDLCGCTLHFTKTSVTADTNAGFLHAIRDVSIENGSIEIDYTHTTGSNNGNAIAFGNRGTDCAYFSPLYDSLLASPMGNLVVRNVRISSNAGVNGNGIFMIGGLQGVTLDHVYIDGQGTLSSGIFYEFGWATNESNREDRQTSHAHNVKITNVIIEDLETTTFGEAVHIGGAYNVIVDNLYVNSAKVVISATPGEAMFYNAWSGVDSPGGKRNLYFNNIVGVSIQGIGVSVIGAMTNSGYLNPLTLTSQQKTDLYTFVLENFSMTGTVNNYGVSTSAAKADIRNGRLSGFQRGIVTTNECTLFSIENVTILGCDSIGMQLGLDTNIWSPKRQKIGVVRNCFIAGSGVGGVTAAISIDNCDSILIENNRLGYETAHDGFDETTQGIAVSVGADGKSVVCRGNHVGSTTGGAVAYNLAAASSSHRGCTIDSATGIVTTNGIWKSVLQGVSADRGDNSVTLAALADYVNQRFDTALTGNKTITLSTTGAVNGDKFHITRTGLGAFTLAVGGLKTIPNSTAASVAVEYDGSAWKLRDYTLL